MNQEQKINHSDMVRRLAKPGADIRKTISVDDITALNAALSITVILGGLYEYQFSGLQLKPQILTDDADAHEYHMLVGMIGEVGELIDCIKKQVIYNKPIDIKNLIEELGDFEFYLTGYTQDSPCVEETAIRAQLETIYGTYGVTKDQALEGNIAKLSERYNNLVYSDQAAQVRADKAEPAKSLIDNQKV